MTATRRINLDNGNNPFALFDSVFGPGAYSHLPQFWTEQAKLTGNFPPYNLSKNEDSTKFNLQLAVAGFGPEEIDVSVNDNQLTISGEIKKKETLSSKEIYVHRGIAERSFKKTFDLGEYVEVQNVSYSNGMLSISLALILPESKKPKKFLIQQVWLIGE